MRLGWLLVHINAKLIKNQSDCSTRSRLDEPAPVTVLARLHVNRSLGLVYSQSYWSLAQSSESSSWPPSPLSCDHYNHFHGHYHQLKVLNRMGMVMMIIDIVVIIIIIIIITIIINHHHHHHHHHQSSIINHHHQSSIITTIIITTITTITTTMITTTTTTKWSKWPFSCSGGWLDHVSNSFYITALAMLFIDRNCLYLILKCSWYNAAFFKQQAIP